MIIRKYVFLALILVAIPFSQARILVTVPDTGTTTSGLEKTFRVGLINTGDPVNLSLEADTRKGLKLEFPEQVRLADGEGVRNPEGSNWYYSGEKYYPIRYVKINASVPVNTETRSHQFSLLITRTYETTISRPTVEEVRELNFRLFSTSELIDTGFNTDEGSNRTRREGHDSEDKDRSPPDIVIKGNDSDKRLKGSQSKDNGAEFESLTLVLSLGVLISLYWLFREAVS